MIGTFTNASAGSSDGQASHAAGSSDGQNPSHAAASSDGQNASHTAGSSDGQNASHAAAPSALEELIRTIGIPTSPKNIDKQPTIDETTGDIEKKDEALYRIFHSFRVRVNQTMEEHTVDPELRKKILEDLTVFCDKISNNKINNKISGELDIGLPELDEIIRAIGDEREKEVIKHLFKVVFAVLDIPNQLSRDVSIPQQLNPNLSYPDNYLYGELLHRFKGIFDIKKLDKDIQELHSSNYWKYTRHGTIDNLSEIVFICFQNLPELSESLRPITINNLGLSEMVKLLNPLTRKSPESGSKPNEETKDYLYTVASNLHDRHYYRALYRVTLETLKTMKLKENILDDSVDRMIARLKSLVA